MKILDTGTTITIQDTGADLVCQKTAVSLILDGSSLKIKNSGTIVKTITRYQDVTSPAANSITELKSKIDFLITIGNSMNSIRKRRETYSGVTNPSGAYTVIFPSAFLVSPNIQAGIINGTNTQTCKVIVSPTGFTVTVVNRNDVLGLLPTYTPVNGASVDVLITEK